MASRIIKWDHNAAGIVTLTIDDPDAGANTLPEAYIDEMGATIGRLHDEVEQITGVVITSAKTTFFAGADLTQVIKAGPDDAQGARRLHHADQGRPSSAGAAGQAGRRRHRRV